MLDYAFSTEAVVQDQHGIWFSLFQMDTVAVRVIRTEYGPIVQDYPGSSNVHRDIISRERAIRIMRKGYLSEHGHPKDNPDELNRIETELIKQLDEGIETWREC